jgi:hypothetical protein
LVSFATGKPAVSQCAFRHDTKVIWAVAGQEAFRWGFYSSIIRRQYYILRPFFYHVTELRLCVEQQWQKALQGKNVKRFFF